MSAWSILLGIVALISTGLGVLTTPVPVLGALFSFGAPALALAGVITGGIALSRGRQAGRATDGATAGLIVSAVAFIPALLTALTCGVCNAMCSAGDLQNQRNFHYSVGQGAGADAGVKLLPPPPLQPPAPSDPTAPAEPAAPAAPRRPGAPPPAFPPPPMNP